MTEAATQNLLQREIAIEQQHVDRVYTRVKELHQRARSIAAEGQERAQLGKFIFSGLFERDVFVYQAARRVRDLDNAHEGLIFGRLDLDDGEVRYVGRLGLRDDDYEPLAIDWRAPAAAPFYRATPQDRQGVIRRRVIDCRRERVVRIDDDLLAPDDAPEDMAIVGDGALMASLSRARHGGMRDIVATIQAEQDVIVRAPADGAVLITGGPGTGKTAVALHRAAYLLYQDRRRFERGGVLIVGPSNAFIRFIDQVLPSLGESAATLQSVGDLVAGIEAERSDDSAAAVLKGSLRMLTVLRRAAKMPPPGAPTSVRLTYRGSVLQLNTEELETVRRRVLAQERRPNIARHLAVRTVLGAMWRKLLEPREISEAEFVEELTERGEVPDFVEEWWPVVDAPTALNWLADPERLQEAAERTLSADEVSVVANSLATEGFSPADVALIEELAQLLGRPRAAVQRPDEDEEDSDEESREPMPDDLIGARVPAYAHIVVDESQDVSPMQWRALSRRGRRASWTVVGDPLQSAWENAEASQAMETALRKSERSSYRLEINYRNPVEIFDLARSVIDAPESELPRAVRSTGHPPEQVKSTAQELGADVRAAAAGLLGEVDGDVGVIVPRPLRDDAKSWISELQADRVQLVDGLEAKGLEFDGVVVVEPSQIASEVEHGDHLLYVVYTRATQRLVTITT